MSQRKTILVCDDEPHILHVVSTKLRNAGFEVMTAEDGQEALDLARAHPPHLVVTDCQMPQLSGLELSVRLKAAPATADVPALMLSALGFDLSAADLQGTNIKAILPKPFSPRDLLAKVQQHLNAGVASGA